MLQERILGALRSYPVRARARAPSPAETEAPNVRRTQGMGTGGFHAG